MAIIRILPMLNVETVCMLLELALNREVVHAAPIIPLPWYFYGWNARALSIMG